MDEKKEDLIPLSNFHKSIIYPRTQPQYPDNYINNNCLFVEKSYICKYILKNGTCFRSLCTFAHDYINFYPKECLNFYNCKNKDCLYIHHEQTKKELFNSIIINNKFYIKDKNKFSSLCKNYKNCKFVNCNFAHNLEEFSPKNCIFGENCNNKEKCVFSHLEEKENLFRRIINNIH